MPTRALNKLPANPLEQRVLELENQLFFARTTMLQLLRPDVREILETMHRLAVPLDVGKWFHGAMQTVVEHVQPQTRDQGTVESLLGPRIPCPLCGNGADLFGRRDKGFAYPAGLLRHLRGQNGAYQCEVAKEVLELARYCNALRKRDERRSNPASGR